MGTARELRQRGVVENPGGGVSNVKKHLVKSAVLLIGLHQPTQRLAIGNRSQRPVNSAYDLAEENLLRRPPQQVPSLRASQAADKPRRLEIKKNKFQEFLWNVFGGGDLGDLHRLRVASRQSDHCLQCIKTFL